MRLWTDAVGGTLAVALALFCGGCGPARDEDAAVSGNSAAAASDGAAAAAASNAPIENLRIPLAVWPSGKVKTQVIAATAQMPEEGGDVVASQIRIEMYRENGDLENLVMAQDCRYNREKGGATSEANVHVERDGVLMTGKGFEWNGTDEIVRIRQNVKVVLQRNVGWDMAPRRGKESEVAE